MIQVDFLPFDVFTVIVALPAPTAVTTPFFTVATELFEDDHVTLLSVVSVGATVAVSVNVSPLFSDKVDLFKVTPEAGKETVTSHVAVLPLDVFTVIVAFPAPTAVTTPFFTVATELFEDDHVTFLSVASEGVTFAVNVYLSPACMSNLVELIEISLATISSEVVSISSTLSIVSSSTLFTLSQLVKTTLDIITKHTKIAISLLNKYFIAFSFLEMIIIFSRKTFPPHNSHYVVNPGKNIRIQHIYSALNKTNENFNHSLVYFVMLLFAVFNEKCMFLYFFT